MVQKDENIYKYLVDNSTDVIYMLSLDGEIQFISPSVETVFGYTPEEVRSKNIRTFLTNDSYKKQDIAMKRALMENDSDISEKLTTQVKNKKGEILLVEIHARFLTKTTTYRGS